MTRCNFDPPLNHHFTQGGRPVKNSPIRWDVLNESPLDTPDTVPVLGVVRRFRLELTSLKAESPIAAVHAATSEALKHCRAVERIVRPLVRTGQIQLDSETRATLDFHLAEMKRLLEVCVARSQT